VLCPVFQDRFHPHFLLTLGEPILSLAPILPRIWKFTHLHIPYL
jgi:hypothetical protein